MDPHKMQTFTFPSRFNCFWNR